MPCACPPRASDCYTAKEFERTTDETIPRDILSLGSIVCRWWSFPGESDFQSESIEWEGWNPRLIKMRETFGEKSVLWIFIRSVGDILQSNGENRLKLPLSKYFFHFLSFMFTVWVFTSCLSYERHICMYWYIPRFLMHAHNQNWFFFFKEIFRNKIDTI